MDTTVVIALCVLGTAATAAYWLWYPTRFRKPKPAPKIRLGDRVTITHGGQDLAHMVLVEFSTSFNDESEARLIDVASFEAKNRVD